MSLTSEFPFATNIVLLFKSDMHEQHSELARAMDRAHQEIRALVDSGSGHVADDSCDNVSDTACIPLTR